MWVKVAVSLAASSSCPAVTVTSCSVSQSVAVNVSVSWSPFRSGSVSTVRSVFDVPATVTVTAPPAGSVASATV